MTAIRDYLRQIAGYLILSVLVENLVAKKEYGPYIRLFLNLLLVLLFVSPILSISADRLGQTWLEAAASWSQGTYLEADLQELNEKQTTLEVAAQKKILEQQIGELLEKRAFRLEELELDTDSDGAIIRIMVIVSRIRMDNGLKEQENRNPSMEEFDVEYQGLSYGEEMEPSRALKNYLGKQLSSSCEIIVTLKNE